MRQKIIIFVTGILFLITNNIYAQYSINDKAGNNITSQIQRKDLQITYIANEGFLLKTSTKKVLIDALFKEGYGIFSVPSKEVTAQIMDSKDPFDSINLLLLTHYHKDHCDPALINEYLSKHKNTPFVTSQPSIVFIDGTCFGFIGKKKQFNVITPDINRSISKTINNIPVKVFGLKHLSFYKDSIDLEETMFNVSFLIEMDGIKIFHSGDIEITAFKEYIAKNKKWTDSIDVAFLNCSLFKSGVPDLEYILKTLHPEYIVLMHILPAEAEEWSAKIKKLKMIFPDILLFNNSLDSQTISM